MFRRIFKIVLSSFALLTALFLLLFKPIDKIPYKEWEGYSYTKEKLSSVRPIPTKGKRFFTGWAKENITPLNHCPIAAYGLRGDFDKVHDSLFVTTFAFSNGLTTCFLVTADILIFPPEVTKRLKEKLGEEKFSKLYFTASHTHSGPGGWMKGPASRLFAGPFSEEYTAFFTNAVLKTIERAQKSIVPASLKYGEIPVAEYVRNRVKYEGIVDTNFRTLVIETEQGKKAAISTYSAHTNGLSSKDNQISADFPGILRDSLVTNGYDAAAWIAGAVGSMANTCDGKFNYACSEEVANGLFRKFKEMKKTSVTEPSLMIGRIPLKLKNPSPDFIHGWTIRPSAFNYLFGTQDVYMQYMQIGNLLFIGFPCDFSGVMAEKIESEVEKDSLQVIFTSFNGGYIGYITPDSYLSINSSETTFMNWYGPYSGGYFDEITRELIKKCSN